MTCDKSKDCYFDDEVLLCTYLVTPSPTDRHANACSSMTHALNQCWATEGCEPDYDQMACVPAAGNHCAALPLEKCAEDEGCFIDFETGYCHVLEKEGPGEWGVFHCSSGLTKAKCKELKPWCEWAGSRCQEVEESSQANCGWKTEIIIMKKKFWSKPVKLLAGPYEQSACGCEAFCEDNGQKDNKHRNWMYNTKTEKCQCTTQKIRKKAIVRSGSYRSSVHL